MTGSKLNRWVVVGVDGSGDGLRRWTSPSPRPAEAGVGFASFMPTTRSRRPAL